MSCTALTSNQLPDGSKFVSTLGRKTTDSGLPLYRAKGSGSSGDPRHEFGRTESGAEATFLLAPRYTELSTHKDLSGGAQYTRFGKCSQKCPGKVDTGFYLGNQAICGAVDRSCPQVGTSEPVGLPANGVLTFRHDNASGAKDRTLYYFKDCWNCEKLGWSPRTYVRDCKVDHGDAYRNPNKEDRNESKWKCYNYLGDSKGAYHDHLQCSYPKDALKNEDQAYALLESTVIPEGMKNYFMKEYCVPQGAGGFESPAINERVCGDWCRKQIGENGEYKSLCEARPWQSGYCTHERLQQLGTDVTCSQFCTEAPHLCHARRYQFCKEQYEKAKEAGGDVFEAFLKDAKCACYLPEHVYDDFITDFIDKTGAQGTLRQYLVNNKKCLFPSCGTASSSYREGECHPMTICAQNVNVGIVDSTVTSEDTSITLQQDCAVEISKQLDCEYGGWLPWGEYVDGVRTRIRDLIAGDPSKCAVQVQTETQEEDGDTLMSNLDNTNIAMIVVACVLFLLLLIVIML